MENNNGRATGSSAGATGSAVNSDSSTDKQVITTDDELLCGDSGGGGGATDTLSDSQCGETFDERTVTLDEVIEAHDELEAEAHALLGGESADVCTYPEGYKPRQPIYCCRTCSSARSALCYGCSVTCHDGHELLELYTKRNLCCDCGNSKFENACTLFKDKKALNERNVYNHNFDGLYCTCNRPYPCKEFEDSEMLQCIVCEDWLHLQHLIDKTESVDLNEVEEVICRSCLAQNEFLSFYADTVYSDACKSEACTLNWLMSNVKIDENRKANSLFFNSHEWRNRLCKCEGCMQRYENGNINFLLDLSDSVQSYVDSHANTNDDDDDTKPTNINEAMTSAIIGVAGREGAIMLFEGYEEMKKKLGVRLKRIAEEKKDVRKEDIYDFFHELETERKRRREDAHRGGL